tara:strand:- start:177 stop:419 length:243 start_codon:yes stop_codon:yes gene_type:complete
MTPLSNVRALAEAAAVYVPKNRGSFRIIACHSEEPCFMAVDEESGQDHTIWFEEVDLALDQFFMFKLMDNKTPFAYKVEK